MDKVKIWALGGALTLVTGLCAFFAKEAYDGIKEDLKNQQETAQKQSEVLDEMMTLTQRNNAKAKFISESMISYIHEEERYVIVKLPNESKVKLTKNETH